MRPPPEGDTAASRRYVSLLIANVVHQQNAVGHVSDNSDSLPDLPVGVSTSHWDDPDAIMCEDDDETTV